jgi:hypothetical protein
MVTDRERSALKALSKPRSKKERARLAHTMKRGKTKAVRKRAAILLIASRKTTHRKKR